MSAALQTPMSSVDFVSAWQSVTFKFTLGGSLAWLSGSALLSINEVTLRQARLVLGCVGKPLWFVTSHSGQLSLLPSAGQKMSAGKSGLTLCGRGVGQVPFIPFVDKRAGGR